MSIRPPITTIHPFDYETILSPSSLEQIAKNITVPNGAEALQKCTLHHGTPVPEIRKVCKGPLNIGRGVGDKGLYVAINEPNLAIEYAQNKTQFGGNPGIMEGRLNPKKNFVVGRIQVVRNASQADLLRGIWPADWSKNPVLSNFMHSHFDILEVCGMENAGLALPSNRIAVVYERAGKDAILWNKMYDLKNKPVPIELFQKKVPLHLTPPRGNPLPAKIPFLQIGCKYGLTSLEMLRFGSCLRQGKDEEEDGRPVAPPFGKHQARGAIRGSVRYLFDSFLGLIDPGAAMIDPRFAVQARPLDRETKKALKQQLQQDQNQRNYRVAMLENGVIPSDPPEESNSNIALAVDRARKWRVWENNIVNAINQKLDLIEDPNVAIEKSNLYFKMLGEIKLPEDFFTRTSKQQADWVQELVTRAESCFTEAGRQVHAKPPSYPPKDKEEEDALPIEREGEKSNPPKETAHQIMGPAERGMKQKKESETNPHGINNVNLFEGKLTTNAGAAVSLHFENNLPQARLTVPFAEGFATAAASGGVYFAVFAVALKVWDMFRGNDREKHLKEREKLGEKYNKTLDKWIDAEKQYKDNKITEAKYLAVVKSTRDEFSKPDFKKLLHDIPYWNLMRRLIAIEEWGKSLHEVRDGYIPQMAKRPIEDSIKAIKDLAKKKILTPEEHLKQDMLINEVLRRALSEGRLDVLPQLGSLQNINRGTSYSPAIVDRPNPVSQNDMAAANSSAKRERDKVNETCKDLDSAYQAFIQACREGNREEIIRTGETVKALANEKRTDYEFDYKIGDHKCSADYIGSYSDQLVDEVDKVFKGLKKSGPVIFTPQNYQALSANVAQKVFDKGSKIIGSKKASPEQKDAAFEDQYFAALQLQKLGISNKDTQGAIAKMEEFGSWSSYQHSLMPKVEAIPTAAETPPPTQLPPPEMVPVVEEIKLPQESPAEMVPVRFVDPNRRVRGLLSNFVSRWKQVGTSDEDSNYNMRMLEGSARWAKRILAKCTPEQIRAFATSDEEAAQLMQDLHSACDAWDSFQAKQNPEPIFTLNEPYVYQTSAANPGNQVYSFVAQPAEAIARDTLIETQLQLLKEVMEQLQDPTLSPEAKAQHVKIQREILLNLCDNMRVNARDIQPEVAHLILQMRFQNHLEDFFKSCDDINKAEKPKKKKDAYAKAEKLADEILERMKNGMYQPDAALENQLQAFKRHKEDVDNYNYYHDDFRPRYVNPGVHISFTLLNSLRNDENKRLNTIIDNLQMCHEFFPQTISTAVTALAARMMTTGDAVNHLKDNIFTSLRHNLLSVFFRSDHFTKFSCFSKSLGEFNSVFRFGTKLFSMCLDDKKAKAIAEGVCTHFSVCAQSVQMLNVGRIAWKNRACLLLKLPKIGLDLCQAAAAIPDIYTFVRTPQEEYKDRNAVLKYLKSWLPSRWSGNLSEWKEFYVLCDVFKIMVLAKAGSIAARTDYDGLTTGLILQQYFDLIWQAYNDKHTDEALKAIMTNLKYADEKSAISSMQNLLYYLKNDVMIRSSDSPTKKMAKLVAFKPLSSIMYTEKRWDDLLLHTTCYANSKFAANDEEISDYPFVLLMRHHAALAKMNEDPQFRSFYLKRATREFRMADELCHEAQGKDAKLKKSFDETKSMFLPLFMTEIQYLVERKDEKAFARCINDYCELFPDRVTEVIRELKNGINLDKSMIKEKHPLCVENYLGFDLSVDDMEKIFKEFDRLEKRNSQCWFNMGVLFYKYCQKTEEYEHVGFAKYCLENYLQRVGMTGMKDCVKFAYRTIREIAMKHPSQPNFSEQTKIATLCETLKIL